MFHQRSSIFFKVDFELRDSLKKFSIRHHLHESHKQDRENEERIIMNFLNFTKLIREIKTRYLL